MNNSTAVATTDSNDRPHGETFIRGFGNGGSMQQSNSQTNDSLNKTAKLQVVERTTKKVVRDSTIGMNQHVRASVCRLVFQSDLRISSLRQVAKLVGITGPRSEAKVLDVIRESVRPTAPAATWRRAA
jgi:hypothetical protein